MRVDLSRIAFVEITEESTIEYEGEAFTSNRVHSPLNQNSQRNNKSGHVNSLNIEEATTWNRPEMSKLTFLNVFDSHKPEEIEKLDRLFHDCKGCLPSRRQLSAIAQSIGIQQSKIKKWFDKRNQEQQGHLQGQTVQHEHDESDIFWNELNAKLDQIDDQILEIEIGMDKYMQ